MTTVIDKNNKKINVSSILVITTTILHNSSSNDNANNNNSDNKVSGPCGQQCLTGAPAGHPAVRSSGGLFLLQLWHPLPHLQSLKNRRNPTLKTWNMLLNSNYLSLYRILWKPSPWLQRCFKHRKRGQIRGTRYKKGCAHHSTGCSNLPETQQ